MPVSPLCRCVDKCVYCVVLWCACRPSVAVWTNVFTVWCACRPCASQCGQMCLLCCVVVCRSTLCVAVWTNVFTVWCWGVPVDHVRHRVDKCVYCVVLGCACRPCASLCGQMCLLCGVGVCLSTMCVTVWTNVFTVWCWGVPVDHVRHRVDNCVYCVVLWCACRLSVSPCGLMCLLCGVPVDSVCHCVDKCVDCGVCLLTLCVAV